ncbi:MAG TPA: uroporphyrinogen decarboxylase family protein, partial [Myxococcota bacterium]|nr:uroporphyrinogen decarboxylase family protein [Myxococcota bacterium]
IDADLTPLVLWEGNCESRLERIADIPPGKAIYFFERTDPFKAKAVLGDTVCLRGFVPASILTTGKPAEVEDYCKRLIDGCAPGGGLIVDGSIGIPDDARIENVFAMRDAVWNYGQAR